MLLVTRGVVNDIGALRTPILAVQEALSSDVGWFSSHDYAVDRGSGPKAVVISVGVSAFEQGLLHLGQLGGIQLR